LERIILFNASNKVVIPLFPEEQTKENVAVAIFYRDNVGAAAMSSKRLAVVDQV